MCLNVNAVWGSMRELGNVHVSSAVEAISSTRTWLLKNRRTYEFVFVVRGGGGCLHMKRLLCGILRAIPSVEVSDEFNESRPRRQEAFIFYTAPSRDTSARWHLEISDLRNFLSFTAASLTSSIFFLSLLLLRPSELSSPAPSPV